MTFVVIPIRTFRGMSRLEPVLDLEERSALMTRLATHTVATCRSAGTEVAVVTGAPEVDAWSRGLGIAVIPEPETGGLDAAARAGVDAAAGRRWMVLHADLPLLEPGDISAMIGAARSGPALAPSHDGGTSAVAGSAGRFPFRYGPGSFRRHLAAVGGRAAVVSRPGLAADIDRAVDLDWFRLLGAAVR
jgi:2-phospho-L-lactate guanylyltransferase